MFEQALELLLKHQLEFVPRKLFNIITSMSHSEFSRGIHCLNAILKYFNI